MKRFIAFLLLCLCASSFASTAPTGTNFITVGSKGVANGLSSTINGGNGFGPDTVGTTTSGIQEAISSLFTTNANGAISGGGVILLDPGTFTFSGTITIPNAHTFNTVIRGSGKFRTVLRYTGQGNLLVDAAGGTDTANTTISDMAFAYVADTNQAYLVKIVNQNETTFERCYFTAWNSVIELGMGLPYQGSSPTNKCGVVGAKVGSGSDNLIIFRDCDFFGIAVGIWAAGDHVRVEDCFFGNIGVYYTPTQQTGTQFGNDGGGDSTSLSAGPCIYLTGGFDAEINDCQFSTVNVGIMPNGPSVRVKDPLFEQVNCNVAVPVSGDAGVIEIDSFQPYTINNKLLQANGTLSGTPGVLEMQYGNSDNSTDFVHLQYRGINYLRVDSSGNQFVKGTLDVTNTLTARGALNVSGLASFTNNIQVLGTGSGKITLYDTDRSNTNTIEAPTDITTNYRWIMPAAPASGLVYGANASGAVTLSQIANGGANTVAHGTTPPTETAVVEADLSLTDVTTANSSTSAHGFLKKLDNNAAHYMDGTGGWSTPGGGNFSTNASTAVADFYANVNVGGTITGNAAGETNLVMILKKGGTPTITANVGATGLNASGTATLLFGGDNCGVIQFTVSSTSASTPYICTNTPSVAFTTANTYVQLTPFINASATGTAGNVTRPYAAYITTLNSWVLVFTGGNTLSAGTYQVGYTVVQCP